ncbi:MAG: LytTR family transcriptional regulator [Kordiimonadaceae bacterium]|nr:LytTR family transcriptional regulator [Kordiimonadaceae bacterium]
MIKAFSKPFPPPRPSLIASGVILITGVLITAGLLFFAGSLTGKGTQQLMLLFGISATGTALIVRNGASHLFPTLLAEQRWTIGREIVFEIIYLQIIAASLALVAVFFNSTDLTASTYALFAGGTSLLGALPIMLKVMITENSLLKRNLQDMAAMLPPAQIPATGPTPKPAKRITLQALTNQHLDMFEHELLYISAHQNYCEVTFLKDGSPTTELIRQNISALADQLKGTSLVRCHRSAVVNTGHVITVSGNAQGYQLHLQHGTAPLSRGFAKTVLPLLLNLS